MNPHKFERIIHTFFNEVCIEIEVHDIKGISHKPKEWFSVPLDVVEQVVDLIVSEKILDYKYDSKNKRIVRR